MKDGLYQFIVGVVDLFLWGGELIGEENLPRHGPAVFIANHLDATGPIAAACSIPLRFHPWVIADMMDKVLEEAQQCSIDLACIRRMLFVERVNGGIQLLVQILVICEAWITSVLHERLLVPKVDLCVGHQPGQQDQ